MTAAAVLVLGSASTALAGTSGVAAQSTAQPADLIPDASWHGRPIMRPDPTPIQVSRPVATTVIAQGAGLSQPGGSAAVRDIQQRLHALGYRTGPVDGAFGPRTRSSVAWFQIKHRLPVTGEVDGMTLGALRARTHGVSAATPPASVAAATGVPAAPRPEAAAPPPLAHEPPAAPAARRPAPGPQDSGLPLPLLLLALALAMVAVAAIATWLRMGAPVPERAQLRRILPRRAQVKRVPVRSPAPRRGRFTPGTAAAHTNGNGRQGQVIGYAVGRNERDFARQQRAIERVCGERGWTLAAVVKEREEPGRRRARRRPGLSHVLRQVAAGGAGQLVVGRLHSLARSPSELALLLEWCRQREVGLVALDVGLDTTTRDGSLAARCLGALGNDVARASGVR